MAFVSFPWISFHILPDVAVWSQSRLLCVVGSHSRVGALSESSAGMTFTPSSGCVSPVSGSRQSSRASTPARVEKVTCQSEMCMSCAVLLPCRAAGMRPPEARP